MFFFPKYGIKEPALSGISNLVALIMAVSRSSCTSQTQHLLNITVFYVAVGMAQLAGESTTLNRNISITTKWISKKFCAACRGSHRMNPTDR